MSWPPLLFSLVKVGPDRKLEGKSELAQRRGIGNGLLMSEEMTANVCSGGFYFLTH